MVGIGRQMRKLIAENAYLYTIYKGKLRVLNGLIYENNPGNDIATFIPIKDSDRSEVIQGGSVWLSKIKSKRYLVSNRFGIIRYDSLWLSELNLEEAKKLFVVYMSAKVVLHQEAIDNLFKKIEML